MTDIYLQRYLESKAKRTKKYIPKKESGTNKEINPFHFHHHTISKLKKISIFGDGVVDSLRGSHADNTLRQVKYYRNKVLNQRDQETKDLVEAIKQKYKNVRDVVHFRTKKDYHFIDLVVKIGDMTFMIDMNVMKVTDEIQRKRRVGYMTVLRSELVWYFQYTNTAIQKNSTEALVQMFSDFVAKVTPSDKKRR